MRARVRLLGGLLVVLTISLATLFLDLIYPLLDPRLTHLEQPT